MYNRTSTILCFGDVFSVKLSSQRRANGDQRIAADACRIGGGATLISRSYSGGRGKNQNGGLTILQWAEIQTK